MKVALIVGRTISTSVAVKPAEVLLLIATTDYPAVRNKHLRRKPREKGKTNGCVSRSLPHRQVVLSSTYAKQTAANKKDQHRRSLDGYDLNNVAGVVKIETLPAGALEEESTAFDDGGEEFCVVMSKRGRKEQKAAQLSKQNASESTTEPVTKSTTVDNDEQQTNEVNRTA
jgi:hypothetical protein